MKGFSKFSLRVINVLAEEFPQTYFVGGAVRNILLSKKIVDVDIATSAQPMQVSTLLKSAGFSVSDTHKKLGVIVVKQGKEAIEITTFRKEVYDKTRFPKVGFVGSPRVDSARRDFTANAIYYSPITKELLDFHHGVKDLGERKLKFIGDAQQRIKEDPLRIVRAYKFSLQYNLQLDDKTLKILQNNLHLLKKVSDARLQKEFNSARVAKTKKLLQKVIHSNT